jgi:LuxR family transcriptional regulator, maltose regulon positive regulatory protein
MARSEARVIDDLWPEAEGDAGEQALAITLSRLRKLVGAAAVRRQAGHLSLDGSQCWVDCQALQRWVLDAPLAASHATCDHIKQLYLGEFLHGEGNATWMLPLRERMHVGLIKALCRGGEVAFANQQVELAADFYELGLVIDALVEAFHAGLIRCHLRNGKLGQAMTVYQRCQRALWNHLGVAPSEATTRLCQSAGAAKSRALYRERCQ